MTKLVVIFGFVVAFAAGLLVGVSRPQPAAAPPPETSAAAPATTRPSRHSWLARELNLTPEQQEQLKAIWSETADRGRTHHEERRRELRGKRDESIKNLILERDREKFDQIHEKYDEETKALEREMRGSFEKAVEQTNAMLTPEQREKYAEFLRRQRWDRDRNHRDRETTRRSDAGATSRPSDQP